MTISSVVKKEFKVGASIFRLQAVKELEFKYPAVGFKNNFVQKLSAL